MSESNYMEQAEPKPKILVLAKMIVKHTQPIMNNQQDVQETLLAFILKVKTEKDLSIPRST